MKLALSHFIIFGCCIMTAAGRAFADAKPANQTASFIWSAPTNKWPEALWVYKVEPQEFSPAVVSNLMALGNFTAKDRAKRVPSNSPVKDPAALYFSNGDESKHLVIYPSLGFIDYHDEGAQARMTEPVVNVPSEEQVPSLALKYVRLAGIDRSQLETKPDSSDFLMHGERRTRGPFNGKGTDEVQARGVFFDRTVDGVPFCGIGLNGGVSILFGNNAKIIDLQVCWRNLKPYGLRPCVRPDQIIEWIKNGSIALPKNIGSLKEIRELKITKAVPIYDGKFGDEKQDFVSPYIGLEAVVDNGSNSISVQFKAPLFLPKSEGE